MALSYNIGHFGTVEELNELLAAGTLVSAATLTVNGTVKKAAFVAAAPVPFADLTAAANAYNALRTSLINAGHLAATA